MPVCSFYTCMYVCIYVCMIIFVVIFYKRLDEEIIQYFLQGMRSKFLVCFVPAPSTVCMHLLEEQINGNYKYINAKSVCV